MYQYEVAIKLAKGKHKKLEVKLILAPFFLTFVFGFLPGIICMINESTNWFSEEAINKIWVLTTIIAPIFMVLTVVNIVVYIVKKIKFDKSMVKGVLTLNVPEDLFIFKSQYGETMIFRASSFLSDKCKRTYYIKEDSPNEYVMIKENVKVNFGGNIQNCGMAIHCYSDGLMVVLEQLGYRPTKKVYVSDNDNDIDG